ncbi:ABC transporter ATP-binding protein [Alteribacter populi]|uniref:ABC transporter ATP-binding protein n=1 Tax=Alteribacter populi TaxID=2011011 RepID=UPI000BBA66CB|nr:ABC transporter ATP-binding protein [Alteribacter populi]
MSERIVQIQNLTFFHSKDKKGLHDVDLTIERGKVYGLWGRNGAGKTTLMRVLAGFLWPDNGEVRVFSDVPFENRNVIKRICFIQENHPLNRLWRIKDVMKIAADFYPNWDEAFAEQSLKTFSLDPEKRIKTLSKGMKTAVALTVGLASRAELTIFDEPTNGLDAGVREKFYELLMNELDDGERTIILSTHFIQELQAYIEEMIVLHEGSLVVQRSIEEIREQAVYVTGSKEILGQYQNHDDVLEVKTLGTTVSILIEKNSEVWDGVRSLDIDMETPSLQDYLLRKTDFEQEEGEKL